MKHCENHRQKVLLAKRARRTARNHHRFHRMAYAVASAFSTNREQFLGAAGGMMSRMNAFWDKAKDYLYQRRTQAAVAKAAMKIT